MNGSKNLPNVTKPSPRPIELLAVENRDRDIKLGQIFGQIAESLQRLAKIAENHEHWIKRLEGEASA